MDFYVDELQDSRCKCSPYVSEWPSVAVPVSLASVGSIYSLVREFTRLRLCIYCEIQGVQQYLFRRILHCLDKFKSFYSSRADCICPPIFKHS